MIQSSSVLMIGGSSAPEFGADHVIDFKRATTYLHDRHPSILVFGYHSGFDEFCHSLLKLEPEALWIVSSEGLPPAQIIEWNNKGRLFAVIDDFADPSLEAKVLAALESHGKNLQMRDLMKLVEEQSQTLKRLTNDLESRVTKRHKTLRKSQKTLEQTKLRLEAFHKALLGIHRAGTVAQMESTLIEALHEPLGIESVKIRFQQQSLMDTDRLAQHMIAIDLPSLKRHAPGGKMLLAKSVGKKFSADEIDFLHELNDALSLALFRVQKLDQAESLKTQWQATFDSIPHALGLANGKLELLKMNRAFQEACAPKSFKDLLGKHCFLSFFGENSGPWAKGSPPMTFRQSRSGTNGQEHFEVTIEPLGLTTADEPLRLVLIRSITDEVRFERRLVAASKLAELGTIGSSIAHELNNPLGGMLSYLQLLLMDIKPDSELYGDVKEMESATLRCRDIVQNLLSFARKQDFGEVAIIQLDEVIQRSVKLIELQSKSMGIMLEVESSREIQINGSLNALSQAFCNLMQNAIDSLTDKHRKQPTFNNGKIAVNVTSLETEVQIQISDNGLGIPPEQLSQVFNPRFTTKNPELHNGMGLTTAFTIISEHGGSLEILSPSQTGTTAVIHLPKV